MYVFECSTITMKFDQSVGAKIALVRKIEVVQLFLLNGDWCKRKMFVFYIV